MNFPISAQTLNTRIAPRTKNSSGVKYSSLKASSNGNGALIEWVTEFENSNLGFSVYHGVGDQRELVSELVPGRMMRVRGGTDVGFSYSIFDARGDLNSTYSIESLDNNGQRNMTGLIATEYVNNLSESEGDFPSRDAQNSNSIITTGEPLLLKSSRSEMEQSSAQVDTNLQSWVAAQPGVKIGVKKEGIYRITRAQLETAGFVGGASPARWQLYANGVEQAFAVAADGSYIEFFGRGIDTLDSGTQIYFLVVGNENGKRILPTARRSTTSGSKANNYLYSFSYKERKTYISSVLNGDAQNFFGDAITTANPPKTIPLNLTGVDYDMPTSSLDIKLQGVSTLSHQVKVSLNGQEIGVVNGGSLASMNQRISFPTSLLAPGGQNNLQLISTVGAGTTLFDTVSVNYSRKHQAEQNTLSFSLPLNKGAVLGGFTSQNIRLFDVTLPENPKLLTNLTIQPDGNNGFQTSLPPNTGRVFYAVEDSAILSLESVPSSVSISANTPSTLSTAPHTAKMVIISPKKFMTQALEWGAYRSSDLTVEVVDLEDIFDEFSFGIYETEATKRFLEHVKTVNTGVKYVLLVGDAHTDTRNYVSNGLRNLIPTKLVDTIYLQTASDDFLTDFNEDGLAEIPIGRIPAHTEAHVSLIFNKVKSFELTAAQNINRGFLFVSDEPEGYNFASSSVELSKLLPANAQPEFINYTHQTDIKNLISVGINKGKYVVNYTGHGNSGGWSSDAIFTGTDAGLLTNADKLSVFTVLNCFNGLFTAPTDSFTEILLKNPNGGAVGVWASTGETTPDVQERMAAQFYSQITAGTLTRHGDLVNSAKSVLTGGSRMEQDVRLSWALLGDPALKMR